MSLITPVRNSSDMEGDELEKLIQDTLDRLDEQYSEARVVHNELYISAKQIHKHHSQAVSSAKWATQKD